MKITRQKILFLFLLIFGIQIGVKAQETRTGSNMAKPVRSSKLLAIKTEFLSPIRGVFSLSGEYAFRPAMTVEGTVGMIYATFNTEDFYYFQKAGGFFLRGGIKFLAQEDNVANAERTTGISKGSYFKPEIVYVYSNNQYSHPNLGSTGGMINEEFRVNGLAVMMNIGEQWILNDMICLDVYGGLGVGTKDVRFMVNGVDKTSTHDVSTIEETGGYGFATLSTKMAGPMLCMQFGFKVGLLLDGKFGKK